jgi:hypothetical protein
MAKLIATRISTSEANNFTESIESGIDVETDSERGTAMLLCAVDREPNRYASLPRKHFTGASNTLKRAARYIRSVPAQ